MSPASYGALSLADGLELDGVRECVGTDQAWSPAAFPAAVPTDPNQPTAICKSDADRRIQTQIPGFELYVRIELEPSFIMTGINGAHPLRNYYDNQCPFRRRADPEPIYDFDGAGDGIRITVTGRYNSIPMRNALGYQGLVAGGTTGLRDKLGCRVSGVVRDKADPIRYLMTSTGEFFTSSYRDSNSQVNAFKVLSGLGGGVKSFSVHPRGAGVYVLRNGFVTRYGNCHAGSAGTFFPITCQTSVGRGIDDVGVERVTLNTSTQEWQVDAAISHILVDYRNRIVYGLSSDRQSLVRLTDSSGTGLSQAYLNSTCAPGAGCVASAVPVANTSMGYVANIAAQTNMPLFMPFTNWPAPGTAGWGAFVINCATLPNRVTTVTVSPTGDVGFMAAPIEIMRGGESTQGTGVYQTWDRQLTMPVYWFEDTVAAMSP